MFEGALGRLLGGALWGLGAGVVLAVVRGSGPDLRPVARTAMRAVVLTTDRIQETFAEARESVDDLYAEAQSERATAMSTNGDQDTPKRASRPRAKS